MQLHRGSESCIINWSRDLVGLGAADPDAVIKNLPVEGIQNLDTTLTEGVLSWRRIMLVSSKKWRWGPDTTAWSKCWYNTDTKQIQRWYKHDTSRCCEKEMRAGVLPAYPMTSGKNHGLLGSPDMELCRRINFAKQLKQVGPSQRQYPSVANSRSCGCFKYKFATLRSGIMVTRIHKLLW